VTKWNIQLPTKQIMLLWIILGIAVVRVSAADADVLVRMRESSWSVGRNPPGVETLVETSVKGAMRRVENTVLGAASDSAGRPVSSVQIDRIDRDTSYFYRPGEPSYLTVPIATARASNRLRASAFLAAQASGAAPRDTLPPVSRIDLGTTRTILGEVCRGVVLELVFSYRDSAIAPQDQLTGALVDTLWLAPPGSAATDIKRFEQDFARVTAADSFLAAANAVQLSQAKGQGLVSVLQRAVRALPGFPLESSFVNLLHGLPKGLSLGDVERQPDGAVVVQRTWRRAIALSNEPLPAERFTVPPELKEVARRP
jgi:hypothetical protein